MLCRANKSPFWKGWQHNRAPLDEVEYHQARGLPVGVIPWSLRASGLDVDWGNPSDFATAYPPMARLPSQRPGGQHLWYRDTQPRRNLQQLAFPGWSGDLRSRTGYLINWAGEAGWEALLDGVIHERGVLFSRRRPGNRVYVDPGATARGSGAGFHTLGADGGWSTKPTGHHAGSTEPCPVRPRKVLGLQGIVGAGPGRMA